MRRLARLAFAAFLVLPAAAYAQSSAEGLPPVVTAALREGLTCAPRGPLPPLEPGAVQIADFNGDGQPDYLLDYGKIVCKGEISGFCGSAGCAMRVFVSGPKGHALVLDDYTVDPVVDTNTKPPTIRLKHYPKDRVLRWSKTRFRVVR